MKQFVGVAFLGLLCLALGAGPIRAAHKNCPRLCQTEIGTCRAAVPPNSSCPHRRHAACVSRLQKARSQCRSRILHQCKQNPDANTCVPPTTTTVPTGGSTTTTLPGTACDLSQTPCTGTLVGSGGISVNEPFDCSNSFANFNPAAMNPQTRFHLVVRTPPADVATLNLELSFNGSPQSPRTYAFPASPAFGDFVLMNLGPGIVPSGVRLIFGASPLLDFAAGPSVGRGTMTMAISSAGLRLGGTPGDWCLHGTLDATLPAPSGGQSVTLHATF